jgi:hypothetical protein
MQQAYFQLPFVNGGKSFGKEIKALFKKGLIRMKLFKKPVPPPKSEAEQEAELLDQINAELPGLKDQEMKNQADLIARGAKLEQVTADTDKLAGVAANFKSDAHKLERVEESKSNHYTSILIGLGGFAVGAAYGFFMGYALPMMLVFGALAGTFSYGLSSLVYGVEEKVTDIEDSFRPLSWLHLAKSAGHEEKPLHLLEKTKQYSPKYSSPPQVKEDVDSAFAEASARLLKRNIRLR